MLLEEERRVTNFLQAAWFWLLLETDLGHLQLLQKARAYGNKVLGQTWQARLAHNAKK